VLYSEGGAHAAQGWVLLRTLGHGKVYFLRGGLLEWIDEVMNPVLGSPGDVTNGTVRDSLAALSRYFGGMPRAAATSPWSRASTPTAAAAVEKLRRRGC
jgi:hypothetical protein